MLYHLIYPLHDSYSILNVFRYITFRTAYASLTALVISLLFGGWLIRKLGEMQVGQSIREEGPESHKRKSGTPTMGGLLIVISIVVPTLLWADLTNRYVWLAVLSILGFGTLGFIDDYAKLRKKRNLGLSGKTKLLAQGLLSGGIGVFLVGFAGEGFSTTIGVPFFKHLNPDLGLLYVPFVMIVIAGASNAVNLTDGLDGLAGGATLIAGATYTILAYIAGNVVVAEYLQVPHVTGAGEVSVFMGAMVGATLGFLWFNAPPAEVFMGDTGSLALGGAIGTVAVITKQELLLVLTGGLFVIEAASVIIQVVSFQTTGKRVFRMSPLHHHFEKLGWAETKIVVRFWIVAIVFALVSLSTLKLR
jgi:phospho-N-acetylmuramoyl-pentapeptide-transferase